MLRTWKVFGFPGRLLHLRALSSPQDPDSQPLHRRSVGTRYTLQLSVLLLLRLLVSSPITITITITIAAFTVATTIITVAATMTMITIAMTLA